MISKDRIRLVGHHTTVTPGEPSPIGIGILVADVDLSGGEFPPPINHTVTGVTITGITIDGQHQQDIGVFVFGASHTTILNDVAVGQQRLRLLRQHVDRHGVRERCRERRRGGRLLCR